MAVAMYKKKKKHHSVCLTLQWRLDYKVIEYWPLRKVNYIKRNSSREPENLQHEVEVWNKQSDAIFAMLVFSWL